MTDLLLAAAVQGATGAITATGITWAILWHLKRSQPAPETDESDGPELCWIPLPGGEIIAVEATDADEPAIDAAIAAYAGDWGRAEEVHAHILRYVAAERIARDIGCRLWGRGDDDSEGMVTR